MTLIYLIRHGRPNATWGGDDPDPGLDETGKGQAEAVARRLAALPEHQRPRRVVSSPLRRCRETAEPTARILGLTVEIEPAVGEIPTPKALPDSERPAWLRRAFEGAWADIVGDLDYEQWRREAAATVAGNAGAAIFSHFVAINGILSIIENDPRVIVFRPDHCSVSVLELGSPGLELVERGAEASTGVL